MSFYHNKWFPRFFYKKFDGGKESGVVGYFLLEWKKVFSIGLLRFSKGSRENYHSHAFFVYGANTEGRHGKGAAKQALTFEGDLWQSGPAR